MRQCPGLGNVGRGNALGPIMPRTLFGRGGRLGPLWDMATPLIFFGDGRLSESARLAIPWDLFASWAMPRTIVAECYRRALAAMDDSEEHGVAACRMMVGHGALLGRHSGLVIFMLRTKNGIRGSLRASGPFCGYSFYVPKGIRWKQKQYGSMANS